MDRSLSNASSDFPDIEPVEWAHVNGSQKLRLLKEHQDEVINYFNEHGAAATMVRYGMMSTTLDKVIVRSGNKPAHEHLRQLERTETIARIAREESRATRLEIQALKRDFRDFTTLVATQVGNALIEPLRRSMDKALGSGEQSDN